jgi:hypothetical protein
MPSDLAFTAEEQSDGTMCFGRGGGGVADDCSRGLCRAMRESRRTGAQGEALIATLAPIGGDLLACAVHGHLASRPTGSVRLCPGQWHLARRHCASRVISGPRRILDQHAGPYNLEVARDEFDAAIKQIKPRIVLGESYAHR